MAKTAKRLSGPALLAGAAATVYTAPAATKAVIRHIHVKNGSGSAATFSLSIGADASATREFDAVSIPANSVQSYYGYWVVDAAEIVQAFSGTASVLGLTLNGDELTAG